MSGTTFQWSTPKSLPVRPRPVWTSSAIRSVPYSSQAFADPRPEVVRRHDGAGLALDRLHDHRGDALARLVGLVELVLDRVRVAEFDEVDPRQERQEGLPVLPSPDEGERSAALAVETAQRADEVGLAGVEAGELDRAFDGVGAVVDEEGVLQVARGDLAQQLRQGAAQRVEQLLARERHALELVGDGPHDLGVPDAGAVDAVAAEAVDVGAAREVLERRALADPLERGVLPHLDDGLAVLEVAAVVIELEVVDRVLLDLVLLLGRQLGRRDDVEPALGFPDELLRVHVRPRSWCGQKGLVSRWGSAAKSLRRRRGVYAASSWGRGWSPPSRLDCGPEALYGGHAWASAFSRTSRPSVSSPSEMTSGMSVRITLP